MMQLLNKAQITEVYETHMRDAFPPDELKPLDHILRMYNDGVYEVWADSADALTVYACVYTGTTPVLLDYFAVVRGMRGKGVGSGFIRRVADLYPSMMLEVERPEEAENGAAHAVRMRRIAFYERAGFAMTSTRATIFGVPYAVMDNLPEKSRHSVRHSYETVYRRFVPDAARYNKNVVIAPENET